MVSGSTQQAVDYLIGSAGSEALAEAHSQAAVGSLHHGFQVLCKLVPEGEKKIRDYYIEVGERDPEVIGEGVRRFLDRVGRSGHGLAAAHQGGNSSGMANRQALQFEADMKALAGGAVSRARIDVERQLPKDPTDMRQTAARVQPTGGRIVIGHGQSPVWLEVRNFVVALGLKVEEFNSVPVAGLSIEKRLNQMKAAAGMAFLVMTGEDEQSDGAKRARQNVVHEIGFFQSAIGFERAIILLEKGCERFSNVDGINYIGFPKGHVSTAFDQIRATLVREGLLVQQPDTTGS